MSERWCTPGREWAVEVIRLTGTPDRHDGEWLRVRYYGWFVADVRAVEHLAEYFDLAELAEDGLVDRPPHGVVHAALRHEIRHSGFDVRDDVLVCATEFFLVLRAK